MTRLKQDPDAACRTCGSSGPFTTVYKPAESGKLEPAAHVCKRCSGSKLMTRPCAVCGESVEIAKNPVYVEGLAFHRECAEEDAREQQRRPKWARPDSWPTANP